MEEVLWCLWVGEQDTDFQLCNWDSDLLPTLFKKDEIRFEYNQWANDWSQNSCTIFAALGMYSDLTNYEFSISEIKEADELSYEPWYSHNRERGRGWYVKDAVDCIRKYVNGRKDLVEKYWKVASYRISKYNDDIIEWCLDKLYTIDWNYCPTTKFHQDYLTDGMVDGTDFWTQTNWHSVDIIKKEWQRSVKNSYKGTKYNVFWLRNELSKLTNFWSYFYIYTLVSEDNYEEIKRLNSIKSECLITIEHLWLIYNLINDKSLRKELHTLADKLRSKIQTCNNMLEKLK